MAPRRNPVLALGRAIKGFFTQVIGNPVVGRELRVRVRLGRSYLLQAVYLAFLTLITLLAYDSIVAEDFKRNPFSAQQALQGFYWTVTTTLITLVVLIVPSLSANAITLERERRTMDLLLATPLTARELLTGKLVGSVALVVLLLALTLPISAVSILLGGTTFAELIETYAMVVLSAMVLSAIALFTSAYAKNSTLAIFWSYLRIGAFLLVLSTETSFQGAWRAVAVGGGMGFAGDELVAPIGLLSPFTAPFASGTVLRAFGWSIPAWLVSLVLCLATTRLLLTGAAIKVGLYDRDLLPSLRRQIAVMTLLMSYLGGFTLTFVGIAVVWVIVVMAIVLLLLMTVLIIFIAPYGHQGDRLCPDDGLFRPLRMFRSSPAGALPYILLVWAMGVAGALAVAWNWRGVINPNDWWDIWILVGYLTCLWVFLWGVARTCSGILKGRDLVNARFLTFGVFVFLLVVPFLLELIFTSLPWEITETRFLPVSPLYPLFHLLDNRLPLHSIDVYLGYSYALFALGLVLGVLSRSKPKQDVS